MRALFVAGLLQGLAVQAQGAAEVPGKDDFLRREGHAVAVLGDRLYIEGGEVSQLRGGRRTGRFSDPANKTLAIALDKSWTTGDVAFEQIDRGGAPTVRTSALWPAPDGKTMYSWGGWVPYNSINEGSLRPRLRKFVASPDGGAGGTWDNDADEPRSGGVALLRTDSSTYTTCNDVGLIMSGPGSVWSDDRIPGRYGYSNGLATTRAVQGLVLYRMAGKTWANETHDARGFDRVTFGPRRQAGVVNGAAACLPANVGTGGGGVAFFLGGVQRDLVAETDVRPMDLQRVLFYDVSAMTMHAQTTTGDRPEGTLAGHCAVVGGSGNGSSYEIFVVGGRGRSPGDVWILTVPGFHWFKAPQGGVNDVNRYHHQCAVARRGGRQMIAVGGYNPAVSDFWGDKDPWANGLKVFDMTALEWRDSYDAGAPAYQTPEVVRKWYAESYPGRDAFKWDREETKALFASMPAPGSNSSAPQPQGPSSGGGGGGGGGDGSSSVSQGTIIGAAVGGGLGLVAIVAGVWFFLRRRKQQASGGSGEEAAAAGQAHASMLEHKDGAQQQPPPPQWAGGVGAHQGHGSVASPVSGYSSATAAPVYEAAGVDPVYEAAGADPVYEMNSSWGSPGQAHELASNQASPHELDSGGGFQPYRPR